jgi:hypothetical protein
MLSGKTNDSNLIQIFGMDRIERWRLVRKIVVANEPLESILLRSRIPK